MELGGGLEQCLTPPDLDVCRGAERVPNTLGSTQSSQSQASTHLIGSTHCSFTDRFLPRG